MSLNIVVFIKPKSEYIEEYMSLLIKLKNITIKEDGCYLFDVYRYMDKVVLIEEWESQNSINFHMEQEYTKEFINSISDNIEEQEIFRLNKIE
ncbi:putative quinol monooxygenase [Vibrio gazogenes]|uniref:Quinol monooxygenase YgiN n=1 Tax=Vibrio gazogenes DSM 21264 = NBRC 103151 TaxID=1123492 RepID=A0A1M5CKS0_VIBGA|nr:antibiotic biosynthesis monooxygenase [Vibrio gazogenes]USP14221.1 antibiotic biosynthesis monooxygenase [Vibrio gazogenes]SHF55207.1 Quinol monooxygenase YgiN [Vibrio gazogenes DSM 21264] [Vibrio gazogenes DSM 21264 = NBRC 103151]SJN53723.1 Antibiotic biosynthesis monooxygenase [Vibrio gazogenes]